MMFADRVVSIRIERWRQQQQRRCMWYRQPRTSCFLNSSTIYCSRWLSKSSPPRKVSPLVALTCEQVWTSYFVLILRVFFRATYLLDYRARHTCRACACHACTCCRAGRRADASTRAAAPRLPPRAHLEHAARDLQDGDIKRAAAKIVNSHLADGQAEQRWAHYNSQNAYACGRASRHCSSQHAQAGVRQGLQGDGEQAAGLLRATGCALRCLTTPTAGPKLLFALPLTRPSFLSLP